MAVPSRRDALEPIADSLEASAVDVTFPTTDNARIANRLNRVDSHESIDSIISHSDVDSGGEGSLDTERTIRVEGSIVYIAQGIRNRSSAYCLAGIGGTANKVCLSEKPCTVAAHSHSTKISLGPGFYLRAGKADNSNTRVVIYSEPLGPVELLKLKPFEFFADLTGSSSSFRDVFDALKRELRDGCRGGAEDAMEVMHRMDRAKYDQVPPKLKEVLSPSGSSGGDSFFSESVSWEVLNLPALLGDLATSLEGDAEPTLSRSCVQNLSSWIEEASKSGKKLSGLVTEMRNMLDSMVERVDTSVSDLSLRVSSTESALGREPDVSDNKVGSTVWGGLTHLDETLRQLMNVIDRQDHSNLASFGEHTHDITQLFDYVRSLNTKSSKDIKYVYKLALEAKNHKAHASRGGSDRSVPTFESIVPDSSDVRGTGRTVPAGRVESTPDFQGIIATLMSRVEMLEAQAAREASLVESSRFDALLSRMQVLEAKSAGGAAVKIFNHLFSSPSDVTAFFYAHKASTVSCGGFYDVFYLLSQLYRYMRGMDSATSQDTAESHDARYQKTLQDLKLSAEDHMMEMSFKSTSSSILPEIFVQGKKFSPKSDLPAYTSYQAFNDPIKETGFAQELPKWIDTVEPHLRESLSQIYSDCPIVKAVAQEVLSKSVEFVRLLIRWVIETVDKLVLGGQSKDDVWSLISKCIKTLFVDFLAKERGLKKFGSLDGNRNLRSASFIWGTLKTHRAVCELVSSEIKNHQLVVGTYSGWLVANSGRKEAALASAQTILLGKKVEALEKELSNANALAAAAKKTADRAFNKAG